MSAWCASKIDELINNYHNSKCATSLHVALSEKPEISGKRDIQIKLASKNGICAAYNYAYNLCLALSLLKVRLSETYQGLAPCFRCFLRGVQRSRYLR